jgi:hypothetical protein
VTATATNDGRIADGKQAVPSLVAEAPAALAIRTDLARITWRRPSFRSGRHPPPGADCLRGRPDLPPGAFLQPAPGGRHRCCNTQAPAGCRRLADLYAGCGTFTFHWRGVRACTAEGDAEAIRPAAAARRGTPSGHHD